MMAAFHLNALQWGIVLSAFFWGIVPFSLVAGVLADKWGAKRVWTIGAVWWSAFTIVTSFAFSYVSLILARLFFGMGEGPTLSNGVKVVSDWTAPEEHTTGTGLAFGGVMLAPAIGAPLIVSLISHHGWQSGFYLLGALGILWVIGWQFLFTDNPLKSRLMSNDEKEWLRQRIPHLTSSRAEGVGALRGLISIPRHQLPTVLSNLWAGFCFGYALYFVMTWLPGYLSLDRHMSLQSMGIAVMFPWFAATLGQIGGGRMSDLIGRLTHSARISKAYWVAACFIVVAITMFLTIQAHSATEAVVWLTLGALANASAGPIFGGVVADTTPMNAGAQAGLLQVFYTLPGAIAPIITGAIVQGTHSFNSAFIIAGVVMVSGTVAVVLFMHPKSADSNTTEVAYIA